jgi:hypothetical protein
MAIASFSADFFEGYTSALRSLENSFRRAGLGISFYAYESPIGEKKVGIRNDSNNIIKTVSIEGDSPAQAIKDVAQAVDCSWTRKSKGGAS